MFYDRYCELCQQKGVSPSRAAIEMGINKGTVSVWKNKGTHPQAAQLQKIADYFDVTVDYLLGMERDIFDGQGLVNGKNIYAAAAIAVSKDDLNLNKKETSPALTKKDERDISLRIDQILSDLEGQQTGLMFDGEPLDDETKELLAASLRSSMETSKVWAKKKFTPKKYRKDE